VSLAFHPLPLRARLDAAALAAARAAQEGRGASAVPEAAFLAEGPAREHLDALLSGRALAVTTGQQAGLFTGPLYTVLKALTAAGLAEGLARRWGRPVVPVFWVAGDDHDFAEIAGCDVVGPDGTRATVELRRRPADAPMLPAFREPLGPDVTAALDRLESLLPGSEFRPGVLEWLRLAYTPDRTMAEAHARAMAALLGPSGVVVLRGWSAPLKTAGADVLRAALRRAGELDALLAEDAARLRASGGDVPVEVGEDLALVMVEAAGGRDRLRVQGDASFVTRRSAEPLGLDALERLLGADPERLSANVLLRPVLEAAVLPTVSYVGGPGELAYLAQIPRLFAALGVPRPAPAPRLSGLLVEPRVRKVLDRFGFVPDALARPESELLAAVAREALPASATGALEALRRALEEGFGAVAAEASAVDRTLERAVESGRNQALAATHEIEKKLLAAVKRSGEVGQQQLVRARAALFPDGRPQDRVYTAASFLSRYGSEVTELLGDAARVHALGLLEAGVGGA
jgi:bacillithiol biosynthesis cysteine-adding enzyme BshC